MHSVRQHRVRNLRRSALRPGTVLFFDDFNGPAGSLLDKSKWKSEIGRGYYNKDGSFAWGWGWGKDTGTGDGLEYQYYRDENNRLDGNSNLVITLKQETPPDTGTLPAIRNDITSGRPTTEGIKQFRPPIRIEARVKFPSAYGVHCTLWTMGGAPSEWPYDGEIDILETFDNYNKLRVNITSLTGPRQNPDNHSQLIDGQYQYVDLDPPNNKVLGNDWFVSRCDLYPDKIMAYQDDVLWQTSTREDYLSRSLEWPYDRTKQHVLFMLAAQHPGSSTFPSTPINMLIDYVKVTKL